MEALYAVVLADDPVWYSYPDEHFSATLTALPASVVVNAARHLPSRFASKKRSRPVAIAALMSHFFSLRSLLVLLSDEELFALCLPFLKSPLDCVTRLTVTCSYFISHYGEIVAAAFRHPPKMLADPTDLNVTNPNLEPPNHEPPNLEPPNLEPLILEPPDFDANVTLGRGGCPSWLSLPASELTRRLERLGRTEIVDCIRGLPLLQRPVYRDLSRRKCCVLLLRHIDRRASYLASLDDYSFLVAALGVLPFAIPASRDCMTNEVLRAEYFDIKLSKRTTM